MKMEMSSIDMGAAGRRRSLKPVPLEEALEHCGQGKFQYLVLAAGGIGIFSAFGTLLIISFVIPAINCEMALSQSQKGVLGSMTFVGMIFSSHLFGFLSDRYGRRYVLMKCYWTCSALSVLASLAIDYNMLVVLWFAMGFALAGILSPGYVYVSEFSTSRYRAKMVLLTVAISTCATIYDPCLSWLILPLKFELKLWDGFFFTSWRVLVLSNAILFFLAIAILSMLPESPKYLLSHGYDKETLEVLQKIYSLNTKSNKSLYPVNEVCLDSDDVSADNNTTDNIIKRILKSLWNQTKELFSPPLLIYTILCCFIHLGIIGMYNMIMLWIPDLVNMMSLYYTDHPEYGVSLCQVLSKTSTDSVPYNETFSFYSEDSHNANWNHTLDSIFHYETYTPCETYVNTNVYLSTITIGAGQLAALGISSFLVKILGRKILLVFLVIIPSLCTLLVTIATSMPLTIALLGLSVILAGAGLPIALSFVVDLFPTSIRSMATSIAMVCGRIGAAVGGQIFGHLQETHCNETYYTLSIALLCIAALCMTIPVKK